LPRDQLQNIARYADELAEHKARKARLEEESTEDEIREQPDASQRMYRRKPRSRSRKSTTTATTTGSGEKETKSSPNTKRQSVGMN